MATDSIVIEQVSAQASPVHGCHKPACSSRSSDDPATVVCNGDGIHKTIAEKQAGVVSSVETVQATQSCSTGLGEGGIEHSQDSDIEQQAEHREPVAYACPGMVTRARCRNALADVDIDDLLLAEHFDDVTNEEYSSTDDNGVYVRFVRAVFTGDDAMASMDDDEDFTPAPCSSDDSSAAITSEADSGDDMCGDDASSPVISDGDVRLSPEKAVVPTYVPDVSPAYGTYAGDTRKLSATWTTPQYRQLYHQVHIHVQLLVQLYAICAKDPSDAARQLANQVLGMLQELQRQSSGNSAYRAACGWPAYSPEVLGMQQQPANYSSTPNPRFWSPPFLRNIFSILDSTLLRLLPAFLEAMDGVPMADDSALDIMRALLMGEKLSKKQKGVGIHVLVQNMLFVAGRALAILQPHLDSALLPAPGPCVKSQLWSPAEDELLALGISRLGRDWRRIQHAYFPGKTVSQVVIRQKNVCARYGNAAVKVAKQRVMGPLTAVEIEKVQQGLAHFADVRSERQKWELISQHYLPHRTSNQLQQLWKGTTSDDGEENVEMTNQFVTQAPFLFPSLRDSPRSPAVANAAGAGSQPTAATAPKSGAEAVMVNWMGRLSGPHSGAMLIPFSTAADTLPGTYVTGLIPGNTHVSAGLPVLLGTMPRLNTSSNKTHYDRGGSQVELAHVLGSADTSDPSSKDHQANFQPDGNVVTSPGQMPGRKRANTGGPNMEATGYSKEHAANGGHSNYESRKRRRSSTLTTFSNEQRLLLRSWDSARSTDSGSPCQMAGADPNTRQTHKLSIQVPSAPGSESQRDSPASLRITFAHPPAEQQPISQKNRHGVQTPAWDNNENAPHHSRAVHRNPPGTPLPHWLSFSTGQQNPSPGMLRTGGPVEDPPEAQCNNNTVGGDTARRAQGQHLKQSLDDLKQMLMSCQTPSDVEALQHRLPAAVSMLDLLQMLRSASSEPASPTASPAATATQGRPRGEPRGPSLRILPGSQSSPNRRPEKASGLKGQRALRLDAQDTDGGAGGQDGGEQQPPAAAQALQELLRLMGSGYSRNEQGMSNSPQKLAPPPTSHQRHHHAGVRRSVSVGRLPSYNTKGIGAGPDTQAGASRAAAAAAVTHLANLGAVDADKLLATLMCQPNAEKAQTVSRYGPGVGLQLDSQQQCAGGDGSRQGVKSIPSELSIGHNYNGMHGYGPEPRLNAQQLPLSADEASRQLLQLLQGKLPSQMEGPGPGPHSNSLMQKFNPSLPHQLLSASAAMRSALNPFQFEAHNNGDYLLPTASACLPVTWGGLDKNAFNAATLDQVAMSMQAKRRRLSCGSPPYSLSGPIEDALVSTPHQIVRPVARPGPALSLLPVSQQVAASESAADCTQHSKGGESMGRRW